MLGLKEPFSGLTHAVGGVLSIVGLCALVRQGVVQGTTWHVVSFAIFGASLILLYTSSALYHLLRLSNKAMQWLRRIDHVMIFVLIAGSYTPFCLVPLRGAWGFSLLIPIWVLAIAGIVATLCRWMGPRWLYTGVYVIMGWLVCIAIPPLMRTMPSGGLFWLVVGGLFYSVGAIIYGAKWPRLKPGVFGFHELWHLFVMAGSLSHYWAVFRYVALVP